VTFFRQRWKNHYQRLMMILTQAPPFNRAVIATVGLLFWLTVSGMDADSLWFDEGWSAYAALEPTLWDAVQFDQTNPPFYYALSWINQQLHGDSVFSLRYLSVLCGLLAFALAVHLAQLTLGARVKLAVALVGVSSAPFWWAMREARMYTLLAMLVMMIAIGFAQLQRGRLRVGLLWMLPAEVLLLYSHNTAPVVIAWLGIMGILWGIQRRPRGWLRWGISQAIVGLLWLPYLQRFLSLNDANSALIRTTPLTFKLWEALWVMPWEAVGHSPTLTLISTINGAVLLLATDWRSARLRDRVLSVGLLLGGVWLALGILGNELHGRYLIMLLPMLWVWAGHTLTRLPRGLGMLWVGCWVGALFLNLNLRATDPAYQKEDVRALVEHYRDTLNADDSVLAWSYADRYELAYYWERLGVSAQRITLPEGADLHEILPHLPTDGRVSLNVWYTQRADYRGMLPCVLSHGTTQLTTFTQVNGMGSELYPQVASVLPSLHPFDATFEVGQVLEVGGLPLDFVANQAVCLPIRLRLTQPTSAELKAVVRVMNQHQREVTRAEGVFATANGRTSTDGTLGEVLTAFPHFRLPLGAPSEPYTVTLTLYDLNHLEGYDVLLGQHPQGKTQPIGTWHPQEGADWVASDDLASVTVIQPTASDGLRYHNGDAVYLELLWNTPARVLPALELHTPNVPMQLIPAPPPTDANVKRDWRVFTLSHDAQSGTATLKLVDDPTPLLTFEVVHRPSVMERPPVAYALDIGFEQAITLVGMDLEQVDTGYEVVLVWQTDAPLPTDYTAFVQALDANGQLIAQSDQTPSQGERPTTTWRVGEYIMDRHTLTLPTPTTHFSLIAGLYDAQGRILTDTQGDHALLFAQ